MDNTFSGLKHLLVIKPCCDMAVRGSGAERVSLAARACRAIHLSLASSARLRLGVSPTVAIHFSRTESSRTEAERKCRMVAKGAALQHSNEAELWLCTVLQTHFGWWSCIRSAATVHLSSKWWSSLCSCRCRPPTTLLVWLPEKTLFKSTYSLSAAKTPQ